MVKELHSKWELLVRVKFQKFKTSHTPQNQLKLYHWANTRPLKIFIPKVV